jgi:glycosyltransferase involved in cell wall biosynthesis
MIRHLRSTAGVQQVRPILEFTIAGVPVTMIVTRHNDPACPDSGECEQYMYALDTLTHDHRPDILLTYGPHPVTQLAMHFARRLGISTVYTLRNYGFEHRGWFTNADAVLTASPYLSAHYARTCGLISTGIPSPVRWEEILANSHERSFLTFVNPAPHKGVSVFARLADWLGARRPDIPVLVVQSAATANVVNSFADIDFSPYPHIKAAPPVPRPADFYALTRVLVMPSLFAEPFGRTAVEAMINGIPPLVSDRGALPETVAGAGRVLALPAWLTASATRLPERAEIEPWFRAVCELWDDAGKYEYEASLAHEIAELRYSESVLQKQYLDYFENLKPGQPLFNDTSERSSQSTKRFTPTLKGVPGS